MDLFRFLPGYQIAIFDTGRQPAFVMLVAFIITYIITRGYTRIARKRGWGSASFGGVHTHHMVFGLIMSLAAGSAVIAFSLDGWLLLVMAAIFGSGAALVLDEFALIFHLQDVYWEREGRKSIDAIVLAVLFGTLFLMHVTPFGINAGDSGYAALAVLAIDIPIVIIAALKGKIFVALFGVFIPILPIVGAIRLAEPSSIWAHKLYPSKGKKMKRTEARYRRYDYRYKHLKDRAWDFIGGKPGRPDRST